MTNSPPPAPRPSGLGFDDLVGIVVAFTVIGSIFFWSVSRKDQGANLTDLPTSPQLSSDPVGTPVPTVRPEETPYAEPTPALSVDPPPASPIPEPSTTPDSLPFVPIPISGTTTPVQTPATSAESTVVPVPATSAETKFSDVPDNYWARPYIEALAERGILDGFPDGSFRPNQPITRAEFAAPLQKAFESKSAVGAINFKDVSADFWAAPVIQQAVTAGFLKGYPQNIFQPNQQIPKVQVLVSLVTGLGITPPADSTQVLQTYQDAPEIPKYATQQVAAATAAGLVANYPEPKLLKPNQDATRAEVAALIYQALVQAGKAEKIPSQYIVQPQ